MISYDKLAEEIYNILHATEYDFELKLYDKNGDDTLSPMKAHWFYAEPEDFNIRLPAVSSTDKAKREVFFWKNELNDQDQMLEIIERVRKTCNLHGVGLTVKDYTKKNMKKRFANDAARENEEDTMDESTDRILELAGVEEAAPLPTEKQKATTKRIKDRMAAKEDLEEEYEGDTRPDAQHGSSNKPIAHINIKDGKPATPEDAEILAKAKEKYGRLRLRYRRGKNNPNPWPKKDSTGHNVAKQHAQGAAIYVAEGMDGSRRRSYMKLGETRLVVIHENMLSEEPSSRNRSNRFNIESVFVETKGERYRIPENYLPSGRAMVRHLHEGGSFSDKVGKAICEKATEIASLVEFIKEYRHRADESLLEMVRVRANTLREACGKMQGPKNYKKLKETFAKKPVIGKDRVQEMVVSLSASMGLMEGEESNRGTPYVARLQIMENATNAKQIEQAMKQITDEARDEEYGTDSDDNFSSAARELVSGSIHVGFSNETKRRLKHVKDKTLANFKSSNVVQLLDTFVEKITNPEISNTLAKIVDKFDMTENYKLSEVELLFADAVKDSALKVTGSEVNEELHELTEWIESIGSDILGESRRDPYDIMKKALGGRPGPFDPVPEKVKASIEKNKAEAERLYKQSHPEEKVEEQGIRGPHDGMMAGPYDQAEEDKYEQAERDMMEELIDSANKFDPAGYTDEDVENIADKLIGELNNPEDVMHDIYDKLAAKATEIILPKLQKS